MNWQSGFSAYAIFLFCTASVVVSTPLACGAQSSAAKQKDAKASRRLDPCKLLTSAEVGSVQGEAVVETKLAPERSGQLLMSQCVYKTATPSKSVSVALAAPDPTKSPALTPRQFWRQQFHPPAASKEQKEVKLPKNDDEEGSEAQRMSGVGEEAYWIGNPITGALYVLHGEEFVRVNVGGIRLQNDRKEKSTTLARKIVSCLK
jgi:hypothetical protein